jgi:hypothetical protein
MTPAEDLKLVREFDHGITTGELVVSPTFNPACQEWRRKHSEYRVVRRYPEEPEEVDPE